MLVAHQVCLNSSINNDKSYSYSPLQQLQMETENQATITKTHHKNHLNSFQIFEPDYYINSAFTLTDSQQRNTSTKLEQLFELTPIQPTHTLAEESREHFRGKSIRGNNYYVSNNKVKRSNTPSIEDIVIEYQKYQNQSKLFKGLVLNKMQDIYRNKPQFSSIEIKTTHLAKEIGLYQNKRSQRSSLQSQSLKEICCESNEDVQKISTTSINYIQKSNKKKAIIPFEQCSPLLPQSKEIFIEIKENKTLNNKLQQLNEFLKNYSKRKRLSQSKERQQEIDWKTLKVMIEKEMKHCFSS